MSAACLLVGQAGSLFGAPDRLVLRGYQTYAVRELNVVSGRLFIQPMLGGNWLYMLWAGVPANRVCLAV